MVCGVRGEQDLSPLAPAEVELDIVIPVYNEGRQICQVLESLLANCRTPMRVLICYDFSGDDTLPAIEAWPRRTELTIDLVLNSGRGPHAAVLSGFRASRAPAVLVFPADDVQNSKIIDRMVEHSRTGSEIVVASRFIPGGCMIGCPWLKAFLVRAANFTLFHIARLPVHDASNGFRLFSRKVIRSIPIESTRGFTYSIELLVKAHRLGMRVTEVPVRWIERSVGTSRFHVLRWLSAYFRWYAYAFITTFGGRQRRVRRQLGRDDVPSLPRQT